MRSCQIIILLKYKRQSDFLSYNILFWVQHRQLFCGFKGKIKSRLSEGSPETPNTSSCEMNSAGHTSLNTWARFNTTRKLSFKENRRGKKNPKPKPQLQSPCAQMNPFELSTQIIFLLNHAGCIWATCVYLPFLLLTGIEPDSWVDPGKHRALQTPPARWPRGRPDQRWCCQGLACTKKVLAADIKVLRPTLSLQGHPSSLSASSSQSTAWVLKTLQKDNHPSGGPSWVWGREEQRLCSSGNTEAT